MPPCRMDAWPGWGSLGENPLIMTEATSEKGKRAMTSEATWPIYSLKLKRRSEVAERTLEFRFDKPAGMTVHPSAGHASGTLVNAILALYPDIGPLQGELRPGIVHRLDKDTSGVMVVARTAAAQASLVRQLKEREVEKRYLAIVHGQLAPLAGVIDAPIARNPRDRKRQAIVEGGREARTRYHTLSAAPEASLLDVTLETGRTHQIRVHMAAVGHPVVGDATYGRRSPLIARQALHSFRLGLTLPSSGEWLAVEAPPPADFRQAALALGLADGLNVDKPLFP